MVHTSVEIVNPGGTGSPAFVISARPEPLPPSRSFMLRLPSAFPLPKKYTCCRDLGFEVRDLSAARFAAFFAISTPSIESYRESGKSNNRPLLCLFRHEHRNVTDIDRDQMPQLRQQR